MTYGENVPGSPRIYEREPAKARSLDADKVGLQPFREVKAYPEAHLLSI